MNFFDILAGTPYWVWILFAYLIIIGIKATKTTLVPLWRLSIIPLIFIVWSIYSIYSKCDNCFQLLAFYLLPLSVGIVIGYNIMQKLTLSVDKNTQLIRIPGSLAPLSLSLSFFLIKYALGVTYALNPILKTSIVLLCCNIIASGIISGISLGRFIAILYAYKRKISNQHNI